MGKARSPSYPAIGLKEAVEKVTKVYERDYQNAIPRDVVAQHMGYESLNGKSLGVLAAALKYGLLEGRGDDTRVSDLSVAIIAHAPGSPERGEALKKAAVSPELFVELDARFQNGKASDQAIRSYLLTQKFIPVAADAAIRSYRETKQLVETESGGYVGGSKLEPSMDTQNEAAPQGTQNVSPAVQSILDWPLNRIKPPAATAPMLQEVFNLDEGPVTLSFPSNLSQASYDELDAALKLFLMRAKRRSHTFTAADLIASADGKITVFQFKVWDSQKGDYVTQPRKSPLKRIMQIGGEVIPGSAEDVDVRALDEHGRYAPEKKEAAN